DRAFRAQGISDRRPRDYTRPEPDQYVRFATSAGDVAYETGAAGMSKGEFTAALLRGLHGTGAAKRWDSDHQQYVVRVRELFDFVRGELTTAGIRQIPRAEDSYTEPNPVLVRFPENAFDAMTLTVSLTPPEVAAETTIETLGPADQISRPPLANPLILHLAPRTYSVRAYAPGFAPRRRSWTIDLYDDTTITVELEPGDAGAPPNWVYHRPVRGFERCSHADSPKASAADPSSVVEIVDESGAVRYSAGSTEFDRMGRYRLRIVEPHGAGPVQVVEVEPRSRREIPLGPPPAPSDLASRLAQDAGLRPEFGGWWTHPHSGRLLAPLPGGAVAGLAALAALAPDGGPGGDLGLAAVVADLAKGNAGLIMIVVNGDCTGIDDYARVTGGLAVFERCHE